MTELISLRFPDISGDVSGHTAFVRGESGVLLNVGSGGGDAISEIGLTGHWTFTLDEDRAANEDYYVAIYSGSAEVAEELVFDGILHAGHSMVDEQFQPAKLTVIRGTVGNATVPTTGEFTPSAISTQASVLNQWRGRVIIFDNNTVTAALRGQATDITGGSAASLPLLSFTALTTAPVSTDTFTIV